MKARFSGVSASRAQAPNPKGKCYMSIRSRAAAAFAALLFYAVINVPAHAVRPPADTGEDAPPPAAPALQTAEDLPAPPAPDDGGALEALLEGGDGAVIAEPPQPAAVPAAPAPDAPGVSESEAEALFSDMAGDGDAKIAAEAVPAAPAVPEAAAEVIPEEGLTLTIGAEPPAAAAVSGTEEDTNTAPPEGLPDMEITETPSAPARAPEKAVLPAGPAPDETREEIAESAAPAPFDREAAKDIIRRKMQEAYDKVRPINDEMKTLYDKRFAALTAETFDPQLYLRLSSRIDELHDRKYFIRNETVVMLAEMLDSREGRALLAAYTDRRRAAKDDNKDNGE